MLRPNKLKIPKRIGDDVWNTKCWFVALFHMPCQHWSTLPNPQVFIHRSNCPGPLYGAVNCANLAENLPAPCTSHKKCPRCEKKYSGCEIGSIHEETENGTEGGLGIGSYEIWNGRCAVDMPVAVLVEATAIGVIGRGYQVGNRLTKHLGLG